MSAEAYIEAFKPSKSDPLAAARRHAMDRFAARGFPGRTDEEWRFTDLRPLTEAFYPPTLDIEGDLGDLVRRYRLEGAHLLVVAGGRLRADLSDPLEGPGFTAIELFTAGGEAEELGGTAALNLAFFSEGFQLDILTAVDQPIQLLHLAAGEAAASFHLRHRVRVAKGASARLIETYDGSGAHWTNVVTELSIAEGARLSHARIVGYDDTALHSSDQRLTIAKDGHYDGFVLVAGGRMSRHDFQAKLEGAHAHCGINAAYLLRGQAHSTIATRIEHLAEHGATREIIKGVVEDRGHGVFQGKILVAKAGQKTDAHQLSRALLLSERARVDAKPELEIYADDVKCSHGATVGDLEEDALFYLISRGIPADQARSMLIEAFVLDAVDAMEDETLRAYLARFVTRWLERGR